MAKNLDRKAAIEQKVARENMVVNKMITVFILLVAYVVLAMRCFNVNEIGYSYFMIDYKHWVTLGVFVLFAAALVYRIIKIKSGANEGTKYFSSAFLLGIAGAALSLLLLMACFHNNTTVLIVFAMAFTALYFIYSIYSAEFFLYSLFTVFGALAITFINKTVYTLFARQYTAFPEVVNIVLLALTLLVSALVIILMYKKPRSLAKVGLKLPSKTHIYPFAVSALLSVAGQLIVMFTGGYFSYVILALFVSYLVIAIIYTVKMM